MRVSKSTLYYSLLLQTQLSKEKWVGQRLIEAEKDNCDSLLAIAIQVEHERTLLQKGNRIGFDVLSWKSGAITNGYSTICTKIDPLMDREPCACASHDNCLTHSMHNWQRKQINKYCKRIANITTDQGYNCSLNPMLYLRDCVKRSAFYLDRISNRVRRKLGLGFTSLAPHYWDKDYIQARETEIWKQSLRYCKEKDIINSKIEENEIPLDKTGWIILTGLMFTL